MDPAEGDPDTLDSPPTTLHIRGKDGDVGNKKTSQLKTLRVGRKDKKKTGDGMRGKNVMDGMRVKGKDMKR